MASGAAGSRATLPTIVNEGGVADEVSTDSSDAAELGHRIEQVVCATAEPPLLVGRASE